MTRIPVRITHADSTAVDSLSVRTYRPDATNGEPDSLAREQSIDPGESMVIELSAFAAVVISPRPYKRSN